MISNQEAGKMKENSRWLTGEGGFVREKLSVICVIDNIHASCLLKLY